MKASDRIKIMQHELNQRNNEHAFGSLRFGLYLQTDQVLAYSEDEAKIDRTRKVIFEVLQMPYPNKQVVRNPEIGMAEAMDFKVYNLDDQDELSAFVALINSEPTT